MKLFGIIPQMRHRALISDVDCQTLESFQKMKKQIILTSAAIAAIAVPSAFSETIFGLTTANSITVFDSASPAVALGGGAVAGLSTNDTLVGIDYRPATGQVYAIGSLSTVYTIDQNTFAASLINTLDPTFVGTSFAFDFNPALGGGEFARIISDTDNNRVVSGNTGLYLGDPDRTPVFYNAGDPNVGIDPNIAGIAYDTNVAVTSSTQQFGIDASLGVLTTVANNAGTLDTIGSLGLTGQITNELGFDISGDTGTAFAAIQLSPNSGLYTINLATGAATLVDQIGSGDLIRDITVIPVPEPSSAILAFAGSLLFLRRRR